MDVAEERRKDAKKNKYTQTTEKHIIEKTERWEKERILRCAGEARDENKAGVLRKWLLTRTRNKL